MEHAEPTLRILLAAYNGEAYLRSLLDSLLAQECAGDYAIIASDDSSTDTTPGILDEYAARYPGIVVRYRAPQRFGSSQAHFCHLIAKFADTPYLMFCDQDDIWHPDKIRCTRTRVFPRLSTPICAWSIRILPNFRHLSSAIPD